MATVYRAEDTRGGDEVAIKVLSPTITGEKRFVRRFRREAEMVKQRLKHPNIVPVIAYGQTQSYVYIVMPMVRGETLSERLVRKGLTEREANLWIGQICDALQFAHSKGVIHRDIKPANIMLTDDGEAMLMDFGLARDVEGSGRLTGSMLMGTPAFVSPEQAQGKTLDARSDQYSLGVVLFLISTGHLPFDSESPMALVLMHIQDRVPRPGRLNPTLGSALERVILKTLAKSRDERFKDMSELKAAYQAAMAGDSVSWVEAPTEVLPERSVVAEVGPARRALPGWVIPAIALPLVGILALLAFRPSDAGTGEENGNGEIVPLAGTTSEAGPTPIPSPADATPISDPTLAPTQVAAADCAGLRLIGFSSQGHSVSWTIDNGTGAQASIVGLGFGWPEANQATQIFLDGRPYLDEDAIDELLTQQDPQMPGDERLEIDSGETRSIRIKFKWSMQEVGRYWLGLTFRSGAGVCELRTEW